MNTMIGEDGVPFLPPEIFARLTPEEVDELRKATPVVRVHPQRVVALRAEDVKRLAAHPSLVQVPGAAYCDVMGIPPGRCRTFLTTMMLMTNGAEHQRRRGAFSKAFAHPVIRAKRPEVRRVADRIVADLPRGEPFNFLDLCAARLPAEMIAEVIGLDPENSGWFARHVYSLSECLVSPYSGHEAIEASAEALYGFVAERLEARRRAPRDDLLSILATDDSERGLEPEELIYQVMGVILGGSDTTRSGFNMIVGRLLGERSLWEAVKADRSLIPAAIEESLRLEPPVGAMPRYAPAPLSIGGVEIAAGQVVNLSTVSAMRDEAQHAEPGRFDLGRKDGPKPHLVFGGGAHRCLGEMLARLEMEEGLAALMDGAPDIEMIEAPRLPGPVGIRKSTPLIARIP